MAIVLLGRPLLRDHRLILGGGFLTFFFGYAVFFSVAAGTQLLDGRRTELAGYDDAAPPNFLGLSRLGDWHYWVAPTGPPADSLAIVTLPSFDRESPRESRLAFANLIQIAIGQGALGIAFDYYLRNTSDVDRILCYWMGQAAEADIPVLFGYLLGDLEPVPETLRDCIHDEQLGHLAGYRESDGRIRMVPLFGRGDISRPSMSYRIAEVLGGSDRGIPERGLVQFTEPRNDLITVEGEPSETDRRVFRGRFILAGSYRPGDRHVTPFGSLEGVRIHAYAAHSLRAGHYIRRVHRWWIFPVILALCYLLTAQQAAGGGRRSLLKAAALLSLGVVGSAALAMWIGLLWFDVSYPLAAVWVLTGLLSGGAAIQRGRIRGTSAEPTRGPAPGPEVSDAGIFDVFLCYNRGGEDEAAVLTVAEALKKRSLRVWLDQWDAKPGVPWHKEVENVIERVGSAAVAVGKEGVGSWQEKEVELALAQFVERDMPVIPILLSGAPTESQALPPMLRTHTSVDLRDGIGEKGLDRLEWAITGIKP
jgi:hypothetical protein